jgi:hypothetical protein
MPPDEFVVQEQVWRTEYSKDLVNKLNGCCMPGKCMVVLSPALDPEAVGETWIHELLHGCVDMTRARSIDEDTAAIEENLVAGLAPVLWAVLRRNKLRFDQ